MVYQISELIEYGSIKFLQTEIYKGRVLTHLYDLKTFQEKYLKRFETDLSPL
jgi:hypothetical protein